MLGIILFLVFVINIFFVILMSNWFSKVFKIQEDFLYFRFITFLFVVNFVQIMRQK